jgi:signal transduction histidine kinase
MFKLLRFYSIASFIAILATGVLLSLFYRQVALLGIFQLAEQSNRALARTTLNSNRSALVEYLKSVANLGPEGVRGQPLPPALSEFINDLMRGHSVAMINIYNHRGVVAFSTKTSQIGGDLSRHPRFISAINGGGSSALIYRDTFNVFDKVTEQDNLMQTYMPIQVSPTEPILGVLEIYTNANNLVRQNERIEFMIVAGAVLILSALYIVLVLAVRRARDIIELQQRTIRERTETLEILSAQMLNSEESHKKKIATELHEGLAQTLSAIKLSVESSWKNINPDDTLAKSMGQIIPLLQGLIKEVRSIATELRPSSLDDFGLLPTINRLCLEFDQRHPEIRINQQISLREHEVPAPLKVILYRIILLALNDIEQYTNSARILLSLMRTGETITLLVDNTPTSLPEAAATVPQGNALHQQPRFARIHELATLSGGMFNVSRNSMGGTMLQASWSC